MPMTTSSRSTCSGSGPDGLTFIALLACWMAAESGVPESIASSHLMRSTFEAMPDPEAAAMKVLGLVSRPDRHTHAVRARSRIAAPRQPKLDGKRVWPSSHYCYTTRTGHLWPSGTPTPDDQTRADPPRYMYHPPRPRPKRTLRSSLCAPARAASAPWTPRLISPPPCAVRRDGTRLVTRTCAPVSPRRAIERLGCARSSMRLRMHG